jgi:hypothetical protein
MSTGQGSISPNDLMKKLVQSKKIMNKVDSGNYERGHINEDALTAPPENLINDVSNVPQIRNKPMEYPNIDKIQNSKLPDVIKKAMIENPISQISLNDTIDMDFLKGAKRLMEQEGLSSKPKNITNTSKVQSIDMNEISVIIENTIRKVLDEKINQILTANQTSTINENLVLKVGDSIFKGKITGVKKSK